MDTDVSHPSEALNLPWFSEEPIDSLSALAVFEEVQVNANELGEEAPAGKLELTDLHGQERGQIDDDHALAFL